MTRRRFAANFACNARDCEELRKNGRGLYLGRVPFPVVSLSRSIDDDDPPMRREAAWGSVRVGDAVGDDVMPLSKEHGIHLSACGGGAILG